MKRRIIVILAILIIIVGTGVCFYIDYERKEFSYHWSCHMEYDETSDYYTYALMYVDKQYDVVDFNVSTKFEGEELILRILSPNDEVVYEKSYNKEGNYRVKLKELEKDEYYTIRVEGVSVKNIHFEIKSKQNE